jgi:hydroxylamine reductase (hybrid-cluster protein)
MKELHKKSADSGVNQMIVKAHRENIELAWDRSEAMQPQCGFGRLAICCTDCLEGPCRVNPFAESEQKSVCGRSQQELVLRQLLAKTADGAAALANLATQFGCQLDDSTWRSVALTGDSMNSCGKCLAELGQTAAAILTTIAKAQGHKRQSTAAGMGVLDAGRINIVCHGHVAPAKLEMLLKSAGDAVNVVSICGSEKLLPVVTNYDSQETALLNGLVDLLVVGSQCVTPAILALAEKLAVPVRQAAALDQAGLQQAVAEAQTSFKRRMGKPAAAAASPKQSSTGYDALPVSKGLVYLGGCGNLANTQDASFLKAATLAIENGLTVVTGGCAGTALAKAGLCDSKAVINLGSCHDAGAFLEIARQAKGGIPVFAIIPELTHNKTLATAVAFASQGIPTWANLGEMSLPAELLGGNLRGFAGVKQLEQVLAEAVAGK